MTVFTKDPDAAVDYGVNWGQDYLQQDEIILTSVWSAVPADVLSLNNESNSGTETGVFVAGGVAGHSYLLSNRITTSNSRTDERSLTIRVIQK